MRTSRDGQRKASALFSQLASPVDRCRVEWKTYLKWPTLSIKKLPGTFKGQFPFTEVARRKQRKGSILCAKNFSKSSVTSERIAIEIAQNVYRNTVCLLNSNFDKAPPRKVVAKHLRHLQNISMLLLVKLNLIFYCLNFYSCSDVLSVLLLKKCVTYFIICYFPDKFQKQSDFGSRSWL